MTTSRAIRVAQAGLAALALVVLSAGLARAAKDTPFGSELVAPNYPDSSIDQTLAALDSIAAIGGHVSYVWIWSDPATFNGWTTLVPVAKAKGLKVFLQMGTIFLGNPAPPPGFAKSFGDVATRTRFMLDVVKLAQTQPEYLVLTTELNFLYRWNRPEFEHFRTLYAEAYRTAKMISPNTKVGVSYHYSMWFVQRYFENADVPAMIAPTDFVAFTSYPEDLVEAGIYGSIADIPAEFHGVARAAYPDKTILFSEVGWSSKAPHSSPELQAEFVRNLPRLMSIAKPELVTWALFADVAFFQRSLLSAEDISFLVNLGVNIDRLFERFNGLGLIDFHGTPKPALGEAASLVFPEP